MESLATRYGNLARTERRAVVAAMQSRPQAPALLGLIALAAACVGCFVLLSSSEMSPVALAGKTSSAAR
eukprot:1860273-Rhodomonas_salina.2